MVTMSNVNTQGVLSSFDDTMDEFIQTTSGWENEQFNIVPFEGSWTAAQVAQHIILSNQPFAEMLRGPVKETEREPDEKIPLLKSIFLDFNVKFSAPATVVPPVKNYQKDELTNSLYEIRASVSATLQGADLMPTCDTDLPFFGYLTRFETASFMWFHTQRHLRQLRNIRDTFNHQ